MVIAIDGSAGVGKSTLAKRIAHELSFMLLNSGSFYRAVAMKFLDMGLVETSPEKLGAIADNFHPELIDEKLYLDGENMESRIYSDVADHWSSVFSALVPVRHAVNRHLHRIGRKTSLVAEGRDMTTVVFPDAEVKLYLTASPRERALRRYKQGSSAMSLADIEKAIIERDERDINKEEGSLRIAKDALTIDTSGLTLDEVYEIMINYIKTCL